MSVELESLISKLRQRSIGSERDEGEIVAALVKALDRRADLRKQLTAADVAFLRARLDAAKGRYAAAGWDESQHPRGQPGNAGEFAPKAGGDMANGQARKPDDSKSQATQTAFDTPVTYQGQKITTRDFLIRVRKLQPQRPSDARFADPHRQRVESFVARLIKADIPSGKDTLYDPHFGTTYFSGVKGRDPLVSQDHKGVFISWGTDSRDRLVRLDPGFDEAEAEAKLRKLFKMKARGGKDSGRQSGPDAESRAAQYARAWNSLCAAGRNVSRDEITAAARELAGAGYYVAWNASDDAPGWEVIPSSVVDAMLGRYARGEGVTNDGGARGGVMFGGEVCAEPARYGGNWSEYDHPRGQPENSGQFAEKNRAKPSDKDFGHAYMGKNKKDGGGGGSTEKRPHLDKAITFHDAAVTKASTIHLTKKQQAAHRDAFSSALSAVSEKSAQAVNRHIKRYFLFGSLLSLNLHSFQGKIPDEEVKQLVENGRGIRAYCDTHGELAIDGPDKEATMQEIYAHELGHAVDGSKFVVSSNLRWRYAWRREMMGKPEHAIGDAASDPAEGLAFFFQKWAGGSTKQGKIKEQFPKCYACLKRFGLL